MSNQIERPPDPEFAARATGKFLAKAVSRPRARRRRRRAHIRGPPKEADDDDADADAYSIKAFCKRHSISPSFYHKLVKAGLGPRTMKLGSRTLITAEAAAEWRAERAAASA